MSSYAPQSKGFKLPTPGVTQGVIAKFFNLGDVKQLKFQSTTEFEMVPQIEVWWQLSEKDENGKPMYLRENYRFSEHAKSKLTKFIMNLFGKTPEPGTFDYERLEGIQRQVVIEIYQNTRGRDRACIATTTPLAPNQAKLEIVPFVLPEYALKFPGYEKFAKGGVQQVKPATSLPGVTPLNSAVVPITDDDLPF